MKHSLFLRVFKPLKKAYTLLLKGLSGKIKFEIVISKIVIQNTFSIKLLFKNEFIYLFISINFNKTATKLCVSSDHGTIHVFILDVPEKNSRST